MSAAASILDVDGISISFGGLQALWNVSFDVREGEILSLIGPNGAGKTTLLNIVSGALAPSAGTVAFRGVQLQGRPAYAINRGGIGRTFQAAEIFGQLSVRDNVAAGGVVASGIGMLACFNRWGRSRRIAGELAHAADEALDFVGLGGLGDGPASNLPAGRQRLLGIARAMATGAELLLLDEPGAGLNESEKTALIDVIRRLSKRGKTIVLVEHDMGVVGELSDRIVVLDQGRVIAAGDPDTVRTNKNVVEAYLGKADTARPARPRTSPAQSKEAAGELLNVRKLHVQYAGVIALDDVSVSVGKGQIVAILGANGAGKSTLLKSIAGVVRPTSGDIQFAAETLIGKNPDRIVRRGISLTPEGRELFPSLSVADNLAMGRYAPLKASGGFLRLIHPSASQRAALQERIELVHELFPVLHERSNQQAGTLSGGQGQMLAIARALMSDPTLLMLDEPSLGLAPLIVEEILNTLMRLRDQGLTVLLVEQNANAALHIADRAYVLSTGRVVAEGSAAEILADTNIAEAYLGRDGGDGGSRTSLQSGDLSTERGMAVQ